MLNFHVKYVQTDRWTDGQTDGRMDRQTALKQYAPILLMRRHKKYHESALTA